MKGLVGAYAALLLVGLLAPFDWYTANDARWTPDGHGLQFVSAGVARSASRPAKLHERLIAAGRFSIEIWISPADQRQRGPARIVSYSESTQWRNFTIGQWESDLAVRLRTTRNNLNGTDPHVTVKDVFAVPGFRHIVMTYDGAYERVYVDGTLRTTTDDVQGTLANWDAEHWLVVGNEHTADRPWRGVIRLLAIYDRVLGGGEVSGSYKSLGQADAPHLTPGPLALYRFRQDGRRVVDESPVLPRVDLEVPDVVEPRRPLLGSGFPTPVDAALNLVIFAPLGALATLALRQAGVSTLRAVGLTLALAAALSCTAEVLQYFLVSRSSELSDLVLNVGGGGVGAWLAVLGTRYRQKGAG
jgi:VanZ family protein